MPAPAPHNIIAMSSRWRLLILVSFLLLASFLFLRSLFQRNISFPQNPGFRSDGQLPSPASDDDLPTESQPSQHYEGAFNWAGVPQKYPIEVESLIPLPSPRPKNIPKIQASFDRESFSEQQLRLARLDSVKANFTHAWRGYKQYAWMRDEVKPLSGAAQDPFGGWAATLVDSLGTCALHSFCNEEVVSNPI